MDKDRYEEHKLGLGIQLSRQSAWCFINMTVELEFSGSHIKQWACLLASVVLGLGVGGELEAGGPLELPGQSATLKQKSLGSVRLCSKDTIATTTTNKGGDHKRIVHGTHCHVWQSPVHMHTHSSVPAHTMHT